VWFIAESETELSSVKQFDPTDEQLELYQGFVYVIIEVDTGKKYLGKKFFWKPKTLPITKTRKRRVKTRTQSDWKEYYGSSKEVKALVENNGVDKYKRIVLKLCETKGLCSYWEAKLQFHYDVLMNDDFYNELISCRIHSKHVRNKS